MDHDFKSQGRVPTVLVVSGVYALDPYVMSEATVLLWSSRCFGPCSRHSRRLESTVCFSTQQPPTLPFRRLGKVIMRLVAHTLVSPVSYN